MNSLLTCALAAFIALASFSTESTRGQEGRSVEPKRFLAEISCDPIFMVLDDVIVDARARGDADFTVVAYPGVQSPPGDVLQHLELVRGYLSDKEGKAPESIGIFVGPTMSKLTIEVFSSANARPKSLVVPFALRYGRPTGLYDDGEVNTLRVGGRWSLGASICSLENVFIYGFAKELTAQSQSSGLIVLHPRNGRPRAEVWHMLYGIRNALLEVNPDLRGRLTFVLGKARGYTEAELWIVPRGEVLPARLRALSRLAPPN